LTDQAGQLLDARRERPHSRRAEQRDEIAAPHSITSSEFLSLLPALKHPFSPLGHRRGQNRQLGPSLGRETSANHHPRQFPSRWLPAPDMH